MAEVTRIPHSRPSPAGLTRGSIPFGHTRERAEGLDCRFEAIESGNDGRGARRLLGGVLVLAAVFAGEDFFGDEAGVLPDRGFDLGGDVGIGLEESLGVLAALSDALAVVGEPSARFFDHARFHPEIDELRALRDAVTVRDIV